MLFFETKMAKVSVYLAHICRRLFRSVIAKSQLRSAYADVAESTFHAFNKGAVQPAGVQDEARVGRSTKITWDESRVHDGKDLGFKTEAA